MTGAVFFITRDLAAHLPAALVVAVVPAVMLGAQILTALLAVLVKWIAIGRCRPTVQPLWSTFVWRL